MPGLVRQALVLVPGLVEQALPPRRASGGRGVAPRGVRWQSRCGFVHGWQGGGFEERVAPWSVACNYVCLSPMSQATLCVETAWSVAPA